MFTFTIIGIVIEILALIVLINTYSHQKTYQHAKIIPYILSIYLPFYVLPLFLSIIVYFNLCANINESVPETYELFNNLRQIVDSLI